MPYNECMIPDGSLKTGTEPKTVQDFLRGLVEPVSRIARHLADNAHDTADIDKIIAFGAIVKNIHKQLREGFAIDDGARSKIIERFFISWNNTALGILYASSKIEENMEITEKHYEILQVSVESIQTYITDFGIAPP